ISLHDNRRALDWFEQMPEVDGSRLGAYGHSVGAYQCHELAAFDPRVRASVRVCWAGDFTRMLHRSGPRVLGVHFLMPTLHAHLHVPELVALSQPNAVLILNARGDAMYDMKAQEKIRRQVERIARRQGRGDEVQWRYFDGPHRFPPEQQADALAFFQRHL
ncbi:MAG: alpha/beta hydrolase family protein, partial [Phycisphaeraceae bacterium]